MATVTNSSQSSLSFRADDGETVTLQPGESAEVDIVTRTWRLCCWECGLSDGNHFVWCPLWRTYEASE